MAIILMKNYCFGGSMNKRIDLIDELRGLAIILMIIYHVFYQEVLWGFLNSKMLDNQIVDGIRLSSEFLFITIAGISSSFSRSNYRRGLICIYCGILITIITYLFVPSELISFGILHFLGTSIVLYELLRNRMRKIDDLDGIVISLMFFVLTYLIFYEEVYLKEFMKIPWMDYLMKNGYLNFIGIKSSSFVSSDFFPIVPWVFLFFGGGFIGEKIKKRIKFKEKVNHKYFSILRFLGRHSLFIYMVHVPIIIGGIFLFQYFFR
jgi:uncharacterized membrane protein